jgi:hypothetical protein
MNTMKIEDFLVSKIKEDLCNLFNQYINDDKEDIDFIIDMKSKMLSLDDMCLEQLIEVNLEYVFEDEMREIMANYLKEWMEIVKHEEWFI